MNYVIKNNSNIYIKLDKNGAPVTCHEGTEDRFEYSKAMNILTNLPKTMRRFHFKVERMPEIQPKSDPENKIQNNNKSHKHICKSDFSVSENIARWVDKFGNCADILDEAKQRRNELIQELSKIDQELLDELHIIELEKTKDMYSGWLIYKKIKEIRERRRIVKDELLIIENVLNIVNPSCLQREQVKRAIEGLFDRQYTLRVISEDDN